MMGKLLAWIGGAAVLGCLAVGIGCLMIVKDRVRIVFASDEPTTGPEPLALLRDDVGSLTQQLDDLRSAIASNFEQLGKGLDERAAQRHGDVATAAELAAVRQLVAEQGALLDQLLARTTVLPAQVAATGQPLASPVAPNVAPVTTLVAPPAPVAQATPPAPVEPPAAPAAPATKTSSFLSFAVPKAKFQFDIEQTYTLVPDLCRVGFDAKSTLHDFTGVTGKVAGSFTADFDDPRGAWRGEVTCEAKELHTGVDGRDTNMWEYLDAPNHAQIAFAIAGFRPAENGIDAAAQTVRGEVFGTMTIRGKSRDLAMPVRVRVDPQKRVVIDGEVPLKLSDYEVPVPSQLGMINMQDEVKVWIALRARVQAGGGK